MGTSEVFPPFFPVVVTVLFTHAISVLFSFWRMGDEIVKWLESRWLVSCVVLTCNTLSQRLRRVRYLSFVSRACSICPVLTS